MTSLLRDRDAAADPEAPLADGEHVDVPPYACEACGAGMLEGQDWCLDCGTAAPGRLGARPGWRAAFTVVGLTLLLLTGAVAASYAALTSDAEREAARPSQGSGNPITAQTPGLGQPANPVTPGETGPGTKAPAVPAPAVVPPPTAVTPPAVPPATTTDPGTSDSTDSDDTTSDTTDDDTTSSGPEPIAGVEATLYDPAKRPGAEFGPPENAVDDSKTSVWDVTVPADNEPLGVGIVLDLGGSYSLKSLKITTPTAGFDIELYGSKGTKLPPDILDSRWDHLVDGSNYADGRSLKLTGKSDGKVRRIALWFAEAADATDPRVAIGDVKVFGTE